MPGNTVFPCRACVPWGSERNFHMMLTQVVQKNTRQLRHVLFLIIITVVLTACGGPPRHSKYSAKIAAEAADIAVGMVGKPYLYGGNTPARGFDCSGLVQYSYAKAGKKVPRSTRQQRRYSSNISLKNAKKGDLLFFNQEGKYSSHVGIYLGNQRFVHAPSSGKNVRISKLSGYWQKHLASSRRLK